MNIEKSNVQNNTENQSPKSRELSETNEKSERKNSDTDIVKPDIQYIETTSAKALFEQNRAAEVKSLAKSEGKSDMDENKRGGLAEDEKTKVKEAHPDWPDQIIGAIGSWKE